jgi:pyruvate,water dikinase
MRAALAGSAATDLKQRVAERKAELERWATVQAPPLLGTFPPGPPPDDPVARAVFKMFGGIPKEAAQANEITGMPGSPGVARGTARLIHSLADAHRLEAGDVLVAQTTSPPWTPLFATAAAVVTDTGGILSHAAVVAREYMIPAVLGTKRATGVIRDGQLVEVDGDEGVVRILAEE